MVVSFFICWVPFHAQRLLASYLTKADNQNQFLLDIYHKLNYISGVTYYLSSTINPLLYQLMSAKFRLAFKETFNCSLFRFLSCCLSDSTAAATAMSTAAAAAAIRHSPSNSLKEREINHHCCCQKFPRRVDSRASQLGTACECSAICGPMSSDSATYECSVDLTGRQQQQDYVNSLGMVARLRGRLKNSSLVSLFRASQDNLAFTSANCPCCLRHNLPVVVAGHQQARAGSIEAHHQHAVSTPLLAAATDVQHGRGQQQFPLSPAPGTNFPAHSMLKFIRSPTPVVCGGVNIGQAASLTRLSSREDDDDGDDDKDDATNVDETTNLNPSPGNSAEVNRRMDSLFKATKIEIDDDLEHNGTFMLTSGESAGPSSSQGSSPEQQMLLAGQQQQQRSNEDGPEPRTGRNNPAMLRGHRRVKKLSSCSTSTGSGTGSQPSQQRQQQPTQKMPARHRRRRSLQHQQQHLMLMHGKEDANEETTKDRKASLCSSTNNDNKQLSACSLSMSSCDRRLDKKLSLSTTTSAIGSYTTTNSQLTAADSAPDSASESWPPLLATSLPNKKVSHTNNGSERRQPDDDAAHDTIEQDPGTLIQDHERLNYELAENLLAAERRPLLEQIHQPTAAAAATANGTSQKC